MRTLLTKTLHLIFGFVIMRSFSISAQDAILWRIYGNGIRDTSWIYGTIHLRDKRVFIYADTVLSYLDLCDKLVLELDLNPLYLLQYSGLIMLPEDSTLHDVFKPDDLAVIIEQVENITGMDFSTFEKLKPVVLLSLVIQHQMRGDMSFTLDEFLYQKGVEKGKEIVGLETFEEQFRLLETIPLEMIADYLKNPMEDEKELELMICDYLTSDIDELLLIMQKDETMVTLKKEFLDDRNRKMAERTVKVLHDGVTLIAVGAGHLPGENGIINLLRQGGYVVEPVILEASEDLKCQNPSL
ncbi:MAG TPA: TraB/GumN family protein [Bacteroidales bacterium]|nr:TraB/GumN family protein [Bacteroidales bacterium]